jgi:hypothetical protein
MEPLDPVARAYQEPGLSPDGRQLAVGVMDADFRGTFILDIEEVHGHASLRTGIGCQMATASSWSLFLHKRRGS